MTGRSLRAIDSTVAAVLGGSSRIRSPKPLQRMVRRLGCHSPVLPEKFGPLALILLVRDKSVLPELLQAPQPIVEWQRWRPMRRTGVLDDLSAGDDHPQR